MQKSSVVWIVCGSLLSLAACKGKAKEEGKTEGKTGGETSAQGSAAPKVVDTPKTPEPPVTGSRKVTKIAAGDGFACAVLDSGGVRCWGRNDGGERGTAKGPDDAATPVDVPGVADAVDLVIGGDSGSSGDIACAWTKSKDVWCWGGQAMTPDHKSEPHAIADLKGALSIALGGGTAYAVKPDGTVWGWGSAAFNALADGSQGGDKPLMQIAGVTGATQVAAGQNHACALLGDGAVSCWGYVGKKQAPTAVSGVAGATALFAETQRDVTCAVTKEATLCWGETQTPEPKAELAGVTKIVGRNHLCALGGDGSVLCWGDNDDFGQLGRSGAANKPTKVEGLPAKAIDIAVGQAFTCAALDTGAAACWGYNQRGQLGDGTLMDRKAPTAVAGISADKAAPAKTGLDAVQEGPDATVWDGMPAACKNGPLEIVAKGYDGKAFAVKAARARSQLGGKTIEISLADHQFHRSWGRPRGTQGMLGIRLAKFEKQGDKRAPAAVDLGEYKLGTDEERLVSPSFETKTGSVNLIEISLTKGVDAGKVVLAHLDDKWVCGELAIVAGASSVKGPFAAPIAK
ncbi:MAG: hypothetical protein SFX73_25695 [Kofleriaceae bacterium]|nr:hypothetical protein [Kofleriaceae bacterium]